MIYMRVLVVKPFYEGELHLVNFTRCQYVMTRLGKIEVAAKWLVTCLQGNLTSLFIYVIWGSCGACLDETKQLDP
jgi:hypothetical protein